MSQSRWFSGLRWSVWCTLGLMLAAPAAYADGMARRAAPMEQPFSWTGLYVGGHAGLVTGDTQGSVPPFTTDYPVNGALYGGQIGYNWQHGLMVYGVEGSFSGIYRRRQHGVRWRPHLQPRFGLARVRYRACGLRDGQDAAVRNGRRRLVRRSHPCRHRQRPVPQRQRHAHRLDSRLRLRIRAFQSRLDPDRIRAYRPRQRTHNLAFVGGGGPTIPDKVDLKMDTIRLGVNIKLY